MLIPLARTGAMEDVAKVVLFLASDFAEYLTGQSVEVNGGLYMPYYTLAASWSEEFIITITLA